MDVDLICLLCLKKCRVLKSIFELVRLDLNSISCMEMIVCLDFVPVKENDGFPTNLCSKCISQLKSSYTFKKQCENSFKTLLQYSNNVDQTRVKIEMMDVLSDDENDNIDSFEYELKLEKKEMDIDHSVENLVDDVKTDCKTSILENDVQNIDENQSIDYNVQEISKSGHVYEPQINKKRKDLKNVRDILGVDIYTLQLENGNFQCNICSQIIKSRKTFIRHLERHMGLKTEFCEICQKYFSHGNCHSHDPSNPWEKQFHCDKCDKAFGHKGTLKLHLQTHIDGNPFECKTCRKGFKRRDLLRAHEKSHVRNKTSIIENHVESINENQSIDYNMREISKSRHVYEPQINKKRKDLKNVRDILGVDVYTLRLENGHFQCNICPQIIKSRKTFIRHLERHMGLKTEFCEICQKSFSHGNCHSHDPSNPLKKQFQCDKCDKAFGHKGTLKLHLQTHIEGNPFECKTCGKGFKRRDLLRAHEKYHTMQKNFLCQYCSKTFLLEISLTKHLVSHTHEKKYKCLKCDKKFTRKSTLRGHEKRHLGIKDYQCKVCDKFYYTSGSLAVHNLTHLDERAYGCRVCSIRFNRPDNRKKHEITVHGFDFKNQKIKFFQN